MYSVSLQSYNYDRRKGLSGSTAVVLCVFFFLLHVSGDIFGNVFTLPTPKRHTISIASFNVKSQTNNALVADNPEPKINETKNEKTIEKDLSNKEIPPKKPDEVIKTETIKEKTQKNNSVKQENNKPSTQKNQTNNTQKSVNEPVTEPSHFGLNNEIPHYPVISFNMGEHGSVSIEYIVGADGIIKYAQIIKSSGYIRLDRAALMVFKKWKFTPSKNIVGTPVDSSKKEITFEFDASRNVIELK